MINRILYILIPAAFISCHDCGFEIDKRLIEDFNNYQKGQTIYFESNKADLDTIKIIEIESFEVCNSFMVQDYKVAHVRIAHLPQNKLKSNTSNWDEEKKEATDRNQALIEVDMRDASSMPLYTKWIGFRDFSSELKVIRSDREVVDTITKDSKNGEVVQIYWSNKKGLIGYKKSDGQIYKVRSNSGQKQ
ncbi:hypothetical protein [Flagellimonas sp.]|uniref:hypothetical protein n=1 Tax=Flagellimonas sp. TaxID=2058762 RepID=UPI003B50DCA0